MSTLDYNSETVKQGIDRLKLLGKHSELLMHSYYGAHIDELQVGAVRLTSCWRPIFYDVPMKSRA